MAKLIRDRSTKEKDRWWSEVARAAESAPTLTYERRSAPMADIRVDPQPPRGAIILRLGNESWLPVEDRKPRHLFYEDWSNPSGKPSGGGFPVDLTIVEAPAGYDFIRWVDGVLYWTTEERTDGE